MLTETILQKNLDAVNTRIAAACKRSGRSISDITLIGVTKTVEADVMQRALSCGITQFGENRVQEVLRKKPEIEGKATWHLIGHLQTNKVRQIIDHVDMIHSVDSLKLLEEIELRAMQAEKVMPILLQVNIADEETKFGVETAEVETLLDRAKSLKWVKVKGLMTIAPFTDDPEDVRMVFREMKILYERLKAIYCNEPIEMKHLSMGMTGDFEVAIEEGATMIRVGTGIFGERQYP